MRYEAVIFDLDGVLCYTDDLHFQAWKRIADELGIAFGPADNDRLRGIGRLDSLEILLGARSAGFSPVEKAALAEKKNRWYQDLLETLGPGDLEPEAHTVLSALRRQGVRLAIGSSSKNARRILSRLGISDRFDAISDGVGLARSKPDPEVFLRAAAMLRVPPAACLVVEDAASGVEAALAAGMDCAAIGDAGGLEAATYRIGGLEELLLIV